jgi:PPP family 3-phenylpropionic acid transporter
VSHDSAPSAGSGQIAWLYAAFFVSHGVAVPYMPVAMKRIGMDGDAIGLAMAASLAIQFAAPPAWGYLADRWGRRGRLLAAASVGAILGMAVATLMPGVPGFLAGFLIYTLARTPVSPLLDALALSHPAVGMARYGRVRRWGSLGFVVAAASVGLVLEGLPARGIPALVSLPWFLVLALCTLGGLPALAEPARPTAGLPLRRLYGERSVWAFLGIAAVHAGCGVPFETYFANHAQDIGLSGAWIGYSWAGGVGLEVVVLSYLGALVSALGPRKLLLLAYSAAVLRWGLTAYLPGGAALALVQVLHGLTFGAAFGASVVWMSRVVPAELQNSSQSVFAAVAWGLGGIVAQLVCGPVYQRLGGRTLFAMAACVELIALVGIWFMKEPPERPPSRES